jgi:hypothetical protein
MGIAADDDDRQGSVALIATDPFDQLEAVHRRQMEIGDEGGYLIRGADQHPQRLTRARE